MGEDIVGGIAAAAIILGILTTITGLTMLGTSFEPVLAGLGLLAVGSLLAGMMEFFK